MVVGDGAAVGYVAPLTMSPFPLSVIVGGWFTSPKTMSPAARRAMTTASPTSTGPIGFGFGRTSCG